MSVELVKQPKSDLSQLLELLESGGGETQSKVSDSLPSTDPPTSQQQRCVSGTVSGSERKRRHSDNREGDGEVTGSEQAAKRRTLEPPAVTVDGEALLPDGYHLVYVRTVRVQTSSRRTGFRPDEPTNVQVEARAEPVPSVRQLGHVHHAPDDERDFRPPLASTQATQPPEEASQTPRPTTSGAVRVESARPPRPSSSLRNLVVPADLMRDCRQVVVGCSP